MLHKITMVIMLLVIIKVYHKTIQVLARLVLRRITLIDKITQGIEVDSV